MLAQSAPVPSAPIRIDHADVAPLLYPSDPGNPGGFVNVTFTNQASKPATDIVFGLERTDGTELYTLDDKGKFSHGVSIQQTFPLAVTQTDLHVVVDHVTFADGSTWSAPEE